MKRNVGTVDRVVRLLAAGGLLGGASAAGPGTALGIVLFVLAIVMALTGGFGSCPLYAPFKLNTCKRRAEGQPAAPQPEGRS